MIQRCHPLPWLLSAVLLAACGSSAPTTGITTTAVPATTLVASAPAPTATFRPTPATPTPIPIPADMLREIHDIENQVESLRGLRRTSPVQRRLLPEAQLRNVMSKDLASAYPADQAERESLTLSALGLIPAGFDLGSFYQDLYGEQVAGFYQPSAGTLYLIDDPEFPAQQRLNYAHEYMNLLQDQNWPKLSGFAFGTSGCGSNLDLCRAQRALVEGDASLIEEQWLRTYASADELTDLFSYYQAFDTPAFDGAPDALQERLLFPFVHGLDFVRWLERNGGWAAVDEAYEDPPQSTEQILHPYLYPADSPVELQALGVEVSSLGSRWTELNAGTLGEFALSQVFSRSLDAEAARQAAEGWGGDVYQAFFDAGNGRSAWVSVQSWDTIRDSQDALLAWRQLGDDRFGPHEMDDGAYVWEAEAGSARLARISNQTLWIEGPTGELVQKLAEAVRFPAAER